MNEGLWVVERRFMGSKRLHDWEMTGCAMEYETAERHYFEFMRYLQGHEMRLLNPSGHLVRHCSDPWAHATTPAHN